MAARSLFNIILKVLGIYFIKDIIIAIPSLLSVFYGFGNLDLSGAFSTLAISLFTLFIYGIIIYYLVFKTGWVIDRFKLLENVPEDPIPLNIHRSTIISISIHVVGLFLVTQGIPMLIRELTKWYQYTRMTRNLAFEPFNYDYLWGDVAEIVIGLLLIGYQRQLVNYIELQNRKNGN